jgi:hypothetical protein
VGTLEAPHFRAQLEPRCVAIPVHLQDSFHSPLSKNNCWCIIATNSVNFDGIVDYLSFVSFQQRNAESINLEGYISEKFRFLSKIIAYSSYPWLDRFAQAHGRSATLPEHMRKKVTELLVTPFRLEKVDVLSVSFTGAAVRRVNLLSA